jgi:hypothetical protein
MMTLSLEAPPPDEKVFHTESDLAADLTSSGSCEL